MTAAATPTSEQSPASQAEAQFLEALSARPIPVETLLETLRALRASGHSAQANEREQALEDMLVETGDRDGLLRLLRARAMGHGDDRTFGAACRALLRDTWKAREAAAFIDAAGFGELPAIESLRRLDVLLACRPGTFCAEKTWGFGVVKQMDAFYKKVVIDFAGRPNHPMTFAYAAETLTLVDAGHLLARRHADPAAIAQLVREKPDEIVRLALRSFGALSITRLEQVLVEGQVLAAGAWRPFWDAARKALKSDPLVEIPAKRSEPILLRSQTRDYGAAWLTEFARERDLHRIVSGVTAFTEANGGKVDDVSRGVLADRLAFAAKGAFNTDPALYARLAALIVETGIAAVPAEELRAHLWDQGRFLRAGDKLVAKETERMVRVLAQEPEAVPRLLGALGQMSFNLLNETLEVLREGPALPAVQARCRELLQSRQAPPTLVIWIFRNRDTLTDWPLTGLSELLAQAIVLIEQTASGETLRMQNQMRLMFESARWFEGILKELDVAGRRALFDRLQASVAWDAVTQRSLIGRMLKYDPILAGRKRGTTDIAPAVPRLTSWRSFRERQEQYRKLVEVDLPKSSQDIAVARSYGDLRENFEYHAAKHAQSLLLQRQGEMDLDLKQVRGTDFADATADVVGMGVCVDLAYPDGRTRRFCILGEWDRDEALGIISCKSRMATCLEGHKVGDSVQIPGENGDEATTIAAITPLDATIHAWVGERPAGS